MPPEPSTSIGEDEAHAHRIRRHRLQRLRNDVGVLSEKPFHYVPRDPAEPDWVVLRDPDGVNVNVSLQQVPERASEKNRLHLDLYTTDQGREIDRLLGLGATRHPREPEAGEAFVVLADPGANLFLLFDVP